jgi:DNA-binding response OmpR family regulator
MVVVQSDAVIAVINNDPEIVAMLETVLRDEGYQTVGATLPDFRDGEQSLLSFLDEHDPRLIIFDVSPPYPETWERFLVLREVATFSRRRVFLTTTDKRALEALIGPNGSFEIFSKPFEIDVLLSAIRRAVAHVEKG